jgi:AcrR family transcriptional regulator
MQPRTARGRATRERMVAAAAELMHLHGVAATSVEDILAASGTGKSQFYHYFEDKEALVRAVLRHVVERSLRDEVEVLARLDRWSGIGAWLDLVATRHEARGLAGGDPLGSLAAELADGSQAVRDDLAEAFRIKQRFLRKGLAVMKERGELRADADPDALAAFATASVQGALLLATIRRDAAVLRTVLDHVLDHLRAHAASAP